MTHLCHAIECQNRVPPAMLMCAKHWRMVPKDMQQVVWMHYRAGQEVDKKPSHEYLLAQRCAVAKVALIEGIFTDAEAVAHVTRLEAP